MVSLLWWTSNQSNSLVFCPCWPLNSLWLQMNWKHNTVASIWHFPLVGRLNPYLCQRRSVRQRIATATSVPACALHSWKHHHLLALPITSALSGWKWAVETICCLPTCTFPTESPPPPTWPPLSAILLLHWTRGRTAPLLLRWGGIIGGDKHHYNVPQWVLHLNLHVVPWGGEGGGGEGVVSVCRPVFSCSLSECPLQWIMNPSHFSGPPVLPEHHPNRRTSGKDDWHCALAFCYHPKYSLLSRMTQRFIRMNFRIMWIRWVSQLSLGCGSLLDNTDPIPKNPKNSFLCSYPA